MERINRIPVTILIGLVALYRYLISPSLGPCCRFYPSCSAYAISAVDQHGIFKGLFFSMRRLLRCHPWHAGGYDPVPERKSCSHKIFRSK